MDRGALLQAFAFGITVPLMPFYWYFVGGAPQVGLLIALYAAGRIIGGRLVIGAGRIVGPHRASTIAIVVSTVGYFMLVAATTGVFASVVTQNVLMFLSRILGGLGDGNITASQLRTEVGQTARADWDRPIGMSAALETSASLGMLSCAAMVLFTAPAGHMGWSKAFVPPAAVGAVVCLLAVFVRGLTQQIAVKPDSTRGAIPCVRSAWSSIPLISLALSTAVAMNAVVTAYMMWETFGLTPVGVGIVFGFAGLLLVFLKAVIERELRKLGDARVSAVIGAMVVTIGMAGFVLIPRSFSVAIFAVSASTLLLGMALLRPALRLLAEHRWKTYQAGGVPRERWTRSEWSVLGWIVGPIAGSLLFTEHERTSFALPCLIMAFVAVGLATQTPMAEVRHV